MFFSAPLDQITYQQIIDFWDADEVESLRVDAKVTFADDKIVKLMAEFGNTYGGLIFVGVQENKTPGPGQKRFEVVGLPYANGDREKLENKAATTIRPALPFEIHPVKDPADSTRCVWIVRVEESHEAPHEVYVGGEPKLVGRYGTRGKNLSLDTIERLIVRRVAARAGTDGVAFLESLPLPNTLKLGACPRRAHQAAVLRTDLEAEIWKILLRTFPHVESRRSRSRTGITLRVPTGVGDETNLTVSFDVQGSLAFSEKDDQKFGPVLHLENFMTRCASFLLGYRRCLKHLRHPTDSVFRCTLDWPGTPASGAYSKVARKVAAPGEIIFDFEGTGQAADGQITIELPLPYGELCERPADVLAVLAASVVRELGRAVEDDELMKLAVRTIEAETNRLS